MYSYLSQIETSFTVRFRRQLCNDLRYKLEQLLKWSYRLQLHIS